MNRGARRAARPRPTSSAPGPGCGRCCATGVERAHRRPVAPARACARSPTAAWSRSPAASSRPTGGWPPTPSTRSRGVLGGRGAAAARSACGWSAATASSDPLDDARAERARAPRRPLRHRGRRDARRSSTATRARRAARPGLPYLKAEAVYAVRHEMARTLDDVLVAPDPGPAARPRRARPRRPRTSPRCSRPSSGWDDAERARQVEAYRAAVDARTRRRRAARDARSTHRSARARMSDSGRADAADRVRRRRGRRARARLAAPRGRASTTRCCARLADACADGDRRRRRGRRGEPRLVAARDDLGARRRRWRHAARRWRGRQSARRGRRGARACATTPRVPVTAAAGRSGVCGGERAAARRRRPRPLRARPGSSTSTTESLVLDVRAGHVRHVLEDDAARRARRDPRALAAVDRPVDRRRLARLPRRRPAVDALREDRGHGRRPRRRARRRPHRPHRRRAARRGRPRPHPAVRRQRGHARRHHRRPAAAAPRAAARAPRRVRVRRRSPPGSTPAGASCAAARPRRCCASTTPSRPTAASRPATAHVLLVLDEGDRGSSTAMHGRRAEECATRRETLDDALVDHWLEHRNDVERARGADPTRLRRRHDGDRGAAGARCPTIYDAATAAIRGGRAARSSASAHQSHALPRRRLPVLHVRRAAAARAARETLLPRRVGRRAPGRCSGTAARSATTTASASTGPASCATRSATAFDVLVAVKARPRPARDPQPGQARPPRPVRRRPAWP